MVVSNTNGKSTTKGKQKDRNKQMEIVAWETRCDVLPTHDVIVSPRTKSPKYTLNNTHRPRNNIVAMNESVAARTRQQRKQTHAKQQRNQPPGHTVTCHAVILSQCNHVTMLSCHSFSVGKITYLLVSLIVLERVEVGGAS